MLAIIDNRPKLLNLKEILEAFLGHRRETVIRRTAHDLRKAEERLHILEGLKIALDNLDAVITLIRESPDPRSGAGRPHDQLRPFGGAVSGHPGNAPAAVDRA